MTTYKFMLKIKCDYYLYIYLVQGRWKMICLMVVNANISFIWKGCLVVLQNTHSNTKWDGRHVKLTEGAENILRIN